MIWRGKLWCLLISAVSVDVGRILCHTALAVNSLDDIMMQVVSPCIPSYLRMYVCVSVCDFCGKGDQMDDSSS